MTFKDEEVLRLFNHLKPHLEKKVRETHIHDRSGLLLIAFGYGDETHYAAFDSAAGRFVHIRYKPYGPGLPPQSQTGSITESVVVGSDGGIRLCYVQHGDKLIEIPDNPAE
jgi:hypothetical protein